MRKTKKLKKNKQYFKKNIVHIDYAYKFSELMKAAFSNSQIYMDSKLGFEPTNWSFLDESKKK